MRTTKGSAITDTTNKSGIGLRHSKTWEIAALWNSLQRRGARQPHAALTPVRWQAEKV